MLNAVKRQLHMYTFTLSHLDLLLASNPQLLLCNILAVRINLLLFFYSDMHAEYKHQRFGQTLLSVVSKSSSSCLTSILFLIQRQKSGRTDSLPTKIWA